jgi:predicted amino acid-binding ACT domain protein
MVPLYLSPFCKMMVSAAAEAAKAKEVKDRLKKRIATLGLCIMIANLECYLPRYL